MKYIYLHGFASRPASRKATYFRERFAERGIELQTPALDRGNFEKLTVSGQLQVIDDCVSGQPATLIGSSLGGYLAALYGARHAEVERLVLLAPRFLLSPSLGRGPRRKSLCRMAQEGSREVFHYGENRVARIGFGLIEDGLQYEDYPEVRQPCLVLHGIRDQVVPVAYAREFVRRHPHTASLLELDTDHEMADVLANLWNSTTRFLFQ